MANLPPRVSLLFPPILLTYTPMRLLLSLSLLLLSVHSLPLSPRSFLPSPRAHVPSSFSCTSSKLISALCHVFNRRLLSKVSSLDLSFKPPSTILSYTNVDPRPVPHSSCHSSATVQNFTLLAITNSTPSIDFQPSSIDLVSAVPLRLPVRLQADVAMKHSFGVGIWKCHVYATDDFLLHGRLETVADMLIGFSLQPKLVKLDTGDVEFSITPQVIVEFELEDTELAYHAEDVGYFTGLWAAIVGFVQSPGLLFKGVTDVTNGGNVGGALIESIKELSFNLGCPVILGLGALPDDVEEKLLDSFGDPYERKAERLVQGFAEDVEDDLNQRMREMLGIGEDGAKRWVLNKHPVDLVNLVGFGALDELFKEVTFSEWNYWGRSESEVFGYGSSWQYCSSLIIRMANL